jgi:putative oxidoreductase
MTMKPDLFTKICEFYRLFVRLLNASQNVVLLGVRLIWGSSFALAGWGKWNNISNVIEFFTELGIPFPAVNAYLVATTELVGGTFLLLGLLSRLTAIPMIITMIVAYVSSEPEALQALFQGDPDLFFSASPFLFLFGSLLILFFGPGCISLDHLLAKIFPPENPKKSQ